MREYSLVCTFYSTLLLPAAYLLQTTVTLVGTVDICLQIRTVVHFVTLIIKIYKLWKIKYKVYIKTFGCEKGDTKRIPQSNCTIKVIILDYQ